MLALIARGETVEVLARWHGDPGRKFALGNLLQGSNADGLQPARLFTDNPDHPRVILLARGTRVALHGARAAVRKVMRGMLLAPRDCLPGWLNSELRQIWRNDERGQPYVYLAGSYASFRDEMQRIGFIGDAQDLVQRRPHYYYWQAGRPRFAAHVKHACRLGVGQELHALLLQGIGYDETGEYTRACLEQGPSVVVEIEQKGKPVPVCWSATHLSGAIGMIYTPAQHRGQGFGSSLTAFHTDLMLARHGKAFAQVRWDNLASQRMFEKLGYRRTREPLTGAAFYWPDGRGPL